MSDATTTKQRMNWLDGARIAAAFCIIGIHSSTDKTGGAFKAEHIPDRVFPITFRAMAEVASTEFFILVSLFLLSMSLSKQTQSYIGTMLLQARRLLVPFAVWTLFYAFFRLYKAHHFGYSDPVLNELTQVSTWIGYFVLGNSNYHMHFLPTLFLLLLFHRAYKLAIHYPLLGLLVIPMVYLNISFGDWMWGTIKNRDVLEYTVRFVKILTYTGYGFFAYSLYGIWKRGIDQSTSFTLFGLASFAIAVGVLIKLVYAYQVVEAGNFIVRRDYIYYGHFLFPCLMLSAFMCSQYFNWPDKLSNWSKYSFGMYLMHPAVLDVLEVAIKGITLEATYYVVLKYCFTAFVSLSLAMLIGRIGLIAWTIGLGPLPFTNSANKRSVSIFNFKSA